MTLWYPEAQLSPGNSGGSFTSGPFKGVLHTTEGSSVQGAVAAYRANNSWPHFTVGRDGVVHQHVGINVAARALRNLAGGVQTNRDSAIQIEVVGQASKPAWPLIQVEAIRRLMRWVEKETGILPVGPAFYPQAGVKRFTQDEWDLFNGWCGHQHVPENNHWDPGAINLSTLLPPTEVPVIPSNAPVVNLILTPSGLGYYLLAADGGVFAFGDAKFLGSVQYTLKPGESWLPTV